MACISSAALFYGTYAFNKDQREMGAWPTVTARVDATSVYQTRFNRADAYRQKIRYSFFIGNMRYSSDQLYSDRFNEGMHWATGDEAGKSLPPVGSDILVHYNPDAPANSVIFIMPVDDSGYYYAGGMLVFAFLMVWFVPKKDNFSLSPKS